MRNIHTIERNQKILQKIQEQIASSSLLRTLYIDTQSKWRSPRSDIMPGTMRSRIIATHRTGIRERAIKGIAAYSEQ